MAPFRVRKTIGMPSAGVGRSSAAKRIDGSWLRFPIQAMGINPSTLPDEVRLAKDTQGQSAAFSAGTPTGQD